MITLALVLSAANASETVDGQTYFFGAWSRIRNASIPNWLYVEAKIDGATYHHTHYSVESTQTAASTAGRAKRT